MDKEAAADLAMQAELATLQAQQAKNETIDRDVALAASADAQQQLVALLGKKAPKLPEPPKPEPIVVQEPKLTLFSLAAKVRKIEEAVDMLIDDNARLRRELRTGLHKRSGAIPQGAGIVDQSGGRR